MPSCIIYKLCCLVYLWWSAYHCVFVVCYVTPLLSATCMSSAHIVCIMWWRHVRCHLGSAWLQTQFKIQDGRVKTPNFINRNSVSFEAYTSSKFIYNHSMNLFLCISNDFGCHYCYSYWEIMGLIDVLLEILSDNWV